MGSIRILCIRINITIDTMLKFDANVNVDAQCERILMAKSVTCKQTNLLLKINTVGAEVNIQILVSVRCL